VLWGENKHGGPFFLLQHTGWVRKWSWTANVRCSRSITEIITSFDSCLVRLISEMIFWFPKFVGLISQMFFLISKICRFDFWNDWPWPCLVMKLNFITIAWNFGFLEYSSSHFRGIKAKIRPRKNYKICSNFLFYRVMKRCRPVGLLWQSLL